MKKTDPMELVRAWRIARKSGEKAAKSAADPLIEYLVWLNSGRKKLNASMDGVRLEAAVSGVAIEDYRKAGAYLASIGKAYLLPDPKGLCELIGKMLFTRKPLPDDCGMKYFLKLCLVDGKKK